MCDVDRQTRMAAAEALTCMFSEPTPPCSPSPPRSPEDLPLKKRKRSTENQPPNHRDVGQKTGHGVASTSDMHQGAASHVPLASSSTLEQTQSSQSCMKSSSHHWIKKWNPALPLFSSKSCDSLGDNSPQPVQTPTSPSNVMYLHDHLLISRRSSMYKAFLPALSLP